MIIFDDTYRIENLFLDSSSDTKLSLLVSTISSYDNFIDLSR